MAAAEQGHGAGAAAIPVLPAAQLRPGALFRADILGDRGELFSGQKVVTGGANGQYWLRRKLRQCQFGWVRHAYGVMQHPQHPHAFRVTGIEYAVKCISLESLMQRQGKIDDPGVEISTMQLISHHGGHPHLLDLVDCVEDSMYIYLVLPFCAGGELFEVIENKGPMDEAEARVTFNQLRLALTRLYELGLIHRDLSCENFMLQLSNPPRWVIIDFGFTATVPFVEQPNGQRLPALIQHYGSRGKTQYLAPEVYFGHGALHPFAVDMWAAGVMLFIMLTGLPPYNVPHQACNRFVMIAQGQLSALIDQDRQKNWTQANPSPAARELLQSLLSVNPLDRPTPEQLMQHPWAAIQVLPAPQAPAVMPAAQPPLPPPGEGGGGGGRGGGPHGAASLPANGQDATALPSEPLERRVSSDVMDVTPF